MGLLMHVKMQAHSYIVCEVIISRWSVQEPDSASHSYSNLDSNQNEDTEGM